jgi:hypothetical protein
MLPLTPLQGKGLNTRRLTNQQLFGADNPNKVPNCYLAFSQNLAAKREEGQQQQQQQVTL